MIHIQKSVNADSRSSIGKPSIDQLTTDTHKHISDVVQAMNFISDMIKDRAPKHDNTKVSNMEEFHMALNSGHIKDTNWYKKHITEERHHLKSHVPDDVNIIDVIEHICDCCMAGLARSGDIYDIDLSPELLQVAVSNTVELLKKNTIVEETSNNSELNDHTEETHDDLLDSEID